VFDGAKAEITRRRRRHTDSGQTVLFDGITGEPFENQVTSA
jgi:DNA-directed RNA polymerase beta subunit